MPHKDPEIRKEFLRKYYERNKEKIKSASNFRNKNLSLKQIEDRNKKAREQYARNPNKKLEKQRKYTQDNYNVVLETKRRYKNRNREMVKRKEKNRVLKLKFNITIEDYEKLLADQNGVCIICKNTDKTGRSLAVDHCHKTGKIRGLLCFRCNSTIGRMEEDIGLLQNTILYLSNDDITKGHWVVLSPANYDNPDLRWLK